MQPTSLQRARQKAKQIFLGCLPIKCLQPSKYKNPQSPLLSPEASKVWVDFNSKSMARSIPTLTACPDVAWGHMAHGHWLSGTSATPSQHSGLMTGLLPLRRMPIPGVGLWEGLERRKGKRLLQEVDLWKPRHSNQPRGSSIHFLFLRRKLWLTVVVGHYPDQCICHLWLHLFPLSSVKSGTDKLQHVLFQPKVLRADTVLTLIPLHSSIE